MDKRQCAASCRSVQRWQHARRGLDGRGDRPRHAVFWAPRLAADTLLRAFGLWRPSCRESHAAEAVPQPLPARLCCRPGDCVTNTQLRDVHASSENVTVYRSVTLCDAFLRLKVSVFSRLPSALIAVRSSLVRLSCRAPSTRSSRLRCAGTQTQERRAVDRSGHVAGKCPGQLRIAEAQVGRDTELERRLECLANGGGAGAVMFDENSPGTLRPGAS